MGRGRSYRAMIGGLSLGLLSVVALSKLPNSVPVQPMPSEADGSAILAAQGGEDPRLPADPICKLSGNPFEIHPERAEEAWGSVENVGPIESTIEAIELGWSGDVKLRQIVVRTSPTGPETIVFDGEETSPALITLETMPTVSPGDTLEIGWRVNSTDGSPWTPNVAVLHTAQGCRVALRPTSAADPSCPLSASAPAPVPGSPGLVQFIVSNDGGEDDALTTLEIDWPVASNGALRAILIEGVAFKEFDEPMDSAPSSIVLTRYRRGGLPLPSGSRLRIGLVFDRPAADGPYVVTAESLHGCTVTATTWTTPPDCGATLKDLTLDGDTAQIRLHNPRTVERELRSLDLFWPVGAVGPLIEVLADGESIWDGEIDRSPASITLDDGVPVPARGSVTLHLRFRLIGEVGDLTGGLPPGAYTLVAGLDGGCRTTLSTVAEPTSCNVSAGPIKTESNEARISLTNVGAAASLREVALTWNAANGALTGVALDDTSLWDETVASSTRALTISIPSGVSPLLVGGMPLDLKLEFERDAAPDGYSISLAFDGPDDIECRRVLINVPLEDKAECNYVLTGLAQDSIDVTAELSNEGSSRGEIAWMEFSWPDPDPLRPLSEVALLAEDGSVRNILWTGRAFTSPAHLKPDPGAGTMVMPGERLRLRLRFAGLIEEVDDPAVDFTLTVGFASGCRVHAVLEDAPPPKRVSMPGVVVGPLPSPLLSCCWRIQVRGESGLIDRLDVAVDDATIFEPEAVEPRPGDNVTVEMLVFDDTTKYAERIRFHRTTKKVRLSGDVQRVSATRRPATGLPEFIVVLDRTISLSDSSIVEGRLERGVNVTVEGEAGADGNVIATFIEVARDRVGELVEITGIVQSAVEMGIPTTGCSPQLWRIGAYVIDVPPDALPTGGAGPGPCPVPVPGQKYRVEGRLTSAKAERSGAPIDRIEAIDTFPEYEGDAVTIGAEGVITKLPAAGLLGEWTLETETGTRTFDVRSLSVVDTRLAPAELGMRASVKIHVSAGGNVALRVRTDWDDG